MKDRRYDSTQVSILLEMALRASSSVRMYRDSGLSLYRRFALALVCVCAKVFNSAFSEEIAP